MKERYILLGRHGKGNPQGALSIKSRILSRSAERETRETASALREECAAPSGGHTVSIGRVLHGNHCYTQESAAIFAEALGAGQKPDDDLDPEQFRSLVDTEAVAERLRSSVEDLTGTNAILVIGHEPQLDWLQRAFCRHPIPLRHSEVVCILVRRRNWGRPVWVLSPSGDEKTLIELKQKIRSKMATAKLLGALISALLAFSLAALVEKERFARLVDLKTVGMMKAAVGFLFAGMGLYLLAMYAYDRLLVPVRLWTHGKSGRPPKWMVARPPSSATLVIYLNMMHIWDWLFTPATWAVVLGLLCLTGAVFGPQSLDLPGITLFGLLVVLVVFLCWKGRPVLARATESCAPTSSATAPPQALLRGPAHRRLSP